MAEYVKKDDVIELLRNLSHGTYKGIPVYSAEIDRAITDVYDLEPEDVSPVRHGRREKHESVSCILGCSVCRDVYIYEPWVTDGKWNYCPNCGCKMLEDLDGEK